MYFEHFSNRLLDFPWQEVLKMGWKSPPLLLPVYTHSIFDTC